MTRKATSRRSVVAGLMTVWGGFLAWFAASGTMARFLGPRTYWVAWFGAGGLLLAGTMALFGARRDAGRGATRNDVAGAGLMLVPVILVVVLPAPQLGAQAASRKAAGVGALSSFIPPPPRGGEVGLQQIHYASLSTEYADALGVTDGLDVELMGFVTHPHGTESGSFGLTRFYISCCAADAVPFTVVVRPTADQAFSDDTWLSIQGTLAREGDGFILQPARIVPVEEPSAPYLY